MDGLTQALVTGLTSFAATNIDDIVILMLFFAQVSPTFRPKHIVAGQYLGFLVLIAASLRGFVGGLLIPKVWIGLLGFVPIAIGISHLLNQKSEEPQVKKVSSQFTSGPELSLLAPQTYQVAAVTIANGGDNIGIYVPLFASSSLPTLIVLLSVFLGMIGLWCGLAYQLTRHQAIAHLLTDYGQKVVPFILIGLGIYILVENGSHRFLLGQ
ncbi:MAG TPA: cadmium resistance transporter [Thermosynechococcaceae cyanobacterium]